MSIHPHHVLLGFDARACWIEREHVFPQSRVDIHLLRVDVERPLSTDVMVWPTVFRNESVSALSLELEGVGDSGLQAPSFVGPVQELWSELEALQETIRTQAAALRGPASVIAVTVESGWEQPFTGLSLSGLDKPSPADLDERWSFLGFDVSDGFLLSGLTNCGYGNERDHLRTTWAPRLNRWHLFDSHDDAKTFAALSDERVESHAPFFVFGIWRLDQR